MSNIAVALREEISRLARKEIRQKTDTTKRSSIDNRKDIAELKRAVRELERKVALLERKVLADAPSTAPAEEKAEPVRFSTKSLRSNRKRLGLSAEDYGKLLGVSAQTVYNWEQGNSRPRRQQLAAYASVRGMGKKEARARLEAMAGS